MVAIYLVLAVLSFLFLCCSLTQQLCRYLKIRAFTIPYGAAAARRPTSAAQVMSQRASPIGLSSLSLSPLLLSLFFSRADFA